MASSARPVFDERWRRAQCYQPFFCEENVWQLLLHSDLPPPRAALFVSNAARTVLMWGQRAATIDPVLWDYHVVAWLPAQGLVIDLDDREQVAWPLGHWLAHAFRNETPAHLQPRFRVVPAAEFLATFSTDRSHMRGADGRPTQPFPSWSAPFDAARGMNLQRFVDFDDPIAGVVTDAAGLQSWLLRWLQSWLLREGRD